MPDITELQPRQKVFIGETIEAVTNAVKQPPPRYDDNLVAPTEKQESSGKLPMEAPRGDADFNSVTLLQLLKVMAEHQQNFKKIFREMRDASSEQQQQLLQDSADSTRAAGQKQMIGSVLSGALQITGAVASIGMAARPAPGSLSSAPATNAATQAGTAAANDAANTAAKAAAEAAASANSFVQKNVAYANSMSAAFQGVGGTAKSGADYAATLDHATKQEQDAKAEKASRSREQSQDATSQAQANIDKTQSILESVIANDHASKMKVIS